MPLKDSIESELHKLYDVDPENASVEVTDEDEFLRKSSQFSGEALTPESHKGKFRVK